MGAKPLSDGITARGLARVNGSDIERFYYNEDFVEKDSNDVVCEIFIPVRPVGDAANLLI